MLFLSISCPIQNTIRQRIYIFSLLLEKKNPNNQAETKTIPQSNFLANFLKDREMNAVCESSYHVRAPPHARETWVKSSCRYKYLIKESRIHMTCSKHFATAFIWDRSAPLMIASSTTLTDQQTNGRPSVWFFRLALRDMRDRFCTVTLQKPITYLLSIDSTTIIYTFLPTYPYFNLSLTAIGSLTHSQ